MDACIEKEAERLTAQFHTLFRVEDTPPKVNTPILRLSPALRRRIYLDNALLILVRYPDEGYAVVNLNGGNSEPSRYQYRPDIKLGIYGLLVCCRTIYAEVSALVYSSNRFVIRYWEKQSLSPLRALTPSSLSSLRFLKIILNQTSCHHRDPRTFEHDWVTCDGQGGEDKVIFRPEWHNTPLDIREARTKAVLSEWRSAVEHLSRHISPQKLELCVVCDVHQDDLEAAREVLEPISLFPELRNCHLRLSRNPAPQLQRMAHDMVLKLRGLAPSNSVKKASQTEPRLGSHLLALPRELRFRILSYTDLVTPWKEVEWSRDCSDGGKYLALYRRCGILGGRGCDPDLHYGCQFFNCWPAHNRLSKAGIGCFCQIRHSAASSTCICWEPPTPLFLVCRKLLHDAQIVFFSGNRFVVHDFRIYLPWSTPCDSSIGAQDDGEDETETKRTRVSEYHSDQLAASIFLRNKVPHNMLRELRELEFVFPPYLHTGWPGEGHRALADWAETLHWARDKLNLRGLTLQLVMTDSPDGETPPPGREEITSEQVDAILAAYRRIASPISILAQSKSSESAAKLRSFYAQVAWPQDWNWGYEDKFYEFGWPWVRDYRRGKHKQLREETERLVLGQQDDEVYVGSREPPWKSIWGPEGRFFIPL